MINSDILNSKIIEKIFENTHKFIFLIDKDTKILEYNKNFQTYANNFKYLKELVTYTHTDTLLNSINKLDNTHNIEKTTTNFCLTMNSIEDIPVSFDLILYFNDGEILVVAEEKPALSHNDAKEYLSMINNFSTTSRELSKTKKSIEKKNLQLNAVSEELKILNATLEAKVNKAVDELRQKDEILLKQAKDAAMGEMIDAIAHQWKNPLGVISLLNQQIQIQCLLNDTLNKDEVIEVIEKSEKQIKHLVETLDEFRTFFRPKLVLKKISVKTIINSVTLLMKDELTKNQIIINTSGKTEEKIEIIPNEFKHVLINLINNSKDAFIEKNIKNRVIEFYTYKEKNSVILKVSDNAGGIPSSIIERVFESNYTTKNNKGTGIGLYMTKQIVEKLDGTIEVFNENEGVCFKISFKQ